MDPQSTNNLDPKLKETYDKVMGTPTASTTPAAALSPAPQAAPGTTPPADASQQTQNASIPQAPYTADNLSFQAAIQQPVNNPAQVPLNVTQPQSTSMLRILYIVGAIIFFAVYTLVWLRIFNIPLPF